MTPVSSKTDLQPIFQSIADPTRRSIIRMLSEEPRSVAQLAGAFDTSRNAVVKHLKVLEASKIVRCQHSGRERINFLDPEPLRQAFDWLRPFEEFWDRKLDAMKDLIESSEHGQS